MTDEDESFYRYPDLVLRRPVDPTVIPIVLCAHPNCTDPVTHLLVSRLAGKGAWICDQHTKEATVEMRITQGEREAWYQRRLRAERKAKAFASRQPKVPNA